MSLSDVAAVSGSEWSILEADMACERKVWMSSLANASDGRGSVRSQQAGGGSTHYEEHPVEDSKERTRVDEAPWLFPYL